MKLLGFLAVSTSLLYVLCVARGAAEVIALAFAISGIVMLLAVEIDQHLRGHRSNWRRTWYRR
jgi:hypothetical protein